MLASKLGHDAHEVLKVLGPYRRPNSSRYFWFVLRSPEAFFTTPINPACYRGEREPPDAQDETVYTRRLKLSGMGWKKHDAQTILTLRVMLLSGVGEDVEEHTLQVSTEMHVRTPRPWPGSEAEIAA